MHRLTVQVYIEYLCAMNHIAGLMYCHGLVPWFTHGNIVGPLCKHCNNFAKPKQCWSNMVTFYDNSVW